MVKFDHIALTEYYNHKFIGPASLLNDIKSNNVGNAEKTLLLDPQFLPDSLEVFTSQGISFGFSDKSDDKYDNIACEDQTLIIEPQKYSRIHFLGFCEFGNFTETAILRFIGQHSMEAVISLNDWWFHGKFMWDFDIINNCEVALEARDNTSAIRYIHFCSISINKTSQPLVEIVLPYNPNMHIFAITLEK